jgi:signal peptidase II
MSEQATTVERRRPDAVPASRYLIFALVAGIGCFADLLSKRWVFQWRGMPGERPIWWIWQGIFGIETSLNTGALFGWGNDRVLWFAALSCLALLGIVVWFVRGRVGHDLTLTAVFGCIAAGILGNLYDRLGLWSIDEGGQPQIHAVRDWIRFSYSTYVWPNFNIADSLLVCSAIYLIWYSFRSPSQSNPVASRSRTKSRPAV